MKTGRHVTALVCATLLLGMAPGAGARVPACTRGCHTLQLNCTGFVRQTLTDALGACTGATRRSCVRTAHRTFRSDRAGCRNIARTHCRTCCRDGAPNEAACAAGVPLPAARQSHGDPDRGRDILLNGDYMTCGIPYSIWAIGGAVSDLIASGFANAAGFGKQSTAPRIPGRTGKNADLPYFLNAFTAPSGVDVVNANCLMCHGGVFDGKLVIGLGNALADFTHGAGGVPTNGLDLPTLLDSLGLSAPEKAEALKIADRATIVAPPTMMRAVGMNPAEMLAVILMVHHDRDTLAWSDAEVTPLTMQDGNGNPIALADAKVTSDPPPWWRAHKKNALFYNGMARGDHRGTMALATSVCVDDVSRAQQVDQLFVDIQAFVDSVRPPPYPRAIDTAMAARGEKVFLHDCAGCHGTYGANETYPSLLIPLDVVKTDPVVANLGVIHAPQLVTWYNASFYGQITPLAPNDPFPGYMPPPLDGIWATAPYLHNGSVPTVELLLDSSARPKYWRRQDLDSTHFDEDALGWPFVAFDAPPTGLPDAQQKLVYDTTLWSQSNAGHPFGDHLSTDERRAVIEYLKTL